MIMLETPYARTSVTAGPLHVLLHLDPQTIGLSCAIHCDERDGQPILQEAVNKLQSTLSSVEMHCETSPRHP